MAPKKVIGENQESFKEVQYTFFRKKRFYCFEAWKKTRKQGYIFTNEMVGCFSEIFANNEVDWEAINKNWIFLKNDLFFLRNDLKIVTQNSFFCLKTFMAKMKGFSIRVAKICTAFDFLGSFRNENLFFFQIHSSRKLQS